MGWVGSRKGGSQSGWAEGSEKRGCRLGRLSGVGGAPGVVKCTGEGWGGQACVWAKGPVVSRGGERVVSGRGWGQGLLGEVSGGLLD